MSPTPLSVKIHRDELELPPLELNNPAGGLTVVGRVHFERPKKVMAFGAESTVTHFQRPLGWNYANGSWEIEEVRLHGTKAQRAILRDTLEEALDQMFFRIDHTDRSGVVRGWRVASANWDWLPANPLTRTLLDDGIECITIDGPHMGQI